MRRKLIKKINVAKKVNKMWQIWPTIFKRSNI